MHVYIHASAGLEPQWLKGMVSPQSHFFLCEIQYHIAVELQKIAKKQRYQVDVELALAAEAKQVIHVENKARVRQAADGTVSIHV